jgi:hypothetical protein
MRRAEVSVAIFGFVCLISGVIGYANDADAETVRLAFIGHRPDDHLRRWKQRGNLGGA